MEMQDSTLDTAAWAAQLLQSPWSITGLTCPGTSNKINIVSIMVLKTNIPQSRKAPTSYY